MPRPRKQGLDYFPLDCDFLSDEKVIAVKVNCGARGVAVTLALLCAIYRQGYYALWNGATALKIANDLPGVSPEAVGKVVEVLVKYDFFDKELFCSESILTSAAIQRRYFESKRIRSAPPDLPYLRVFATETPVVATETPVVAAKRNIKESKVNKTSSPVVDDAKSPPTPPPVPAGLDGEITIMAADDLWLDQLQIAVGIGKEQLLSRMPEFAANCRSGGKTGHDSIDDARQHFRNWILKKKQHEQPNYHRGRGAAGTSPTPKDRKPKAGYGLIER